MLGLGAHGGPYGYEGHSGAGHMEHVGLDDSLVHGGRHVQDGWILSSLKQTALSLNPTSYLRKAGSTSFQWISSGRGR